MRLYHKLDAISDDSKDDGFAAIRVTHFKAQILAAIKSDATVDQIFQFFPKLKEYVDEHGLLDD